MNDMNPTTQPDTTNERDTVPNRRWRISLLTKLKIIIISILGVLSIVTLRHLVSNKGQNIPITSRSLQITTRIIPPHRDAIRVPADMWKKPSDDPSWQPVDLPNCCNDLDGGERRRRLTTTSKKLFTKCSIGDVDIRYKGPGHGYTPGDLRRALRKHKGDLILMGDSLTRQWFEALSCYLGGWDSWRGFASQPIERNRDDLEREITEILMGQQRSIWRERGNLGTLSGKHDSAFGSFTIPSDGTAMEQRVIYQGIHNFNKMDIAQLMEFYDRDYPREFARERPLFVLNMGLHFNHDAVINEKTRSDLRGNLRLMYHICRDRGMRCIFRESTPQHFQNPNGNGLFMGYDHPRACMTRPPETFGTLDGWRNDVIRYVVKEVVMPSSSHVHGGSFVKIMPLFDRLAYLNFAHNGQNPTADCSHYKSDPEYWEPWHVSLTQVLEEVSRVVHGPKEEQ